MDLLENSPKGPAVGLRLFHIGQLKGGFEISLRGYLILGVTGLL